MRLGVTPQDAVAMFETRDAFDLDPALTAHAQTLKVFDGIQNCAARLWRVAHECSVNGVPPLGRRAITLRGER